MNIHEALALRIYLVETFGANMPRRSERLYNEANQVIWDTAMKAIRDRQNEE